jgi:hypothetical protein
MLTTCTEGTVYLGLPLLIMHLSRSTPKGEMIRPAIALSFLGYHEDVNRLSQAWQQKIGKATKKRLGKGMSNHDCEVVDKR